jgi:uncharacterized protein YggE
MPEMPTISVRGEARDEVEPELATLSVTVMAHDRDRQQAMRRLTDRQREVNAVLDEQAEAIEKRHTSSLSIHPVVKKGEKVSGYTGRVATTVVVKDFAELGSMMLRLASVDQAEVSGPWWDLRPESPAYRAARHAAIEDALARAADYAQALGARVTRLVRLSDAGLSHEPRMRAMTFAARAEVGDVDGLTLDLEPAPQSVYASIEATFEISEPSVLASG